MRIGLRHVAHGDDGIGIVEKGDAQHARIGAHDGQGLLRPENGEEIALIGAADRGAGLDIALGVGEEGDAAIAGCAAGQTAGKGALPIGGGA